MYHSLPEWYYRSGDILAKIEIWEDDNSPLQPSSFSAPLSTPHSPLSNAVIPETLIKSFFWVRLDENHLTEDKRALKSNALEFWSRELNKPPCSFLALCQQFIVWPVPVSTACDQRPAHEEMAFPRLIWDVDINTDFYTSGNELQAHYVLGSELTQWDTTVRKYLKLCYLVSVTGV